MRDIWSADTLKLNFSLNTGLRLRLLTRVFALDRRTPSQYRASLTYGSAEENGIQSEDGSHRLSKQPCQALAMNIVTAL